MFWVPALVLNSKQEPGHTDLICSAQWICSQWLFFSKQKKKKKNSFKHPWRRLFFFCLEGTGELLEVSLVDISGQLEASELLFLTRTWLFMQGLSSSSWANFSRWGFQEKGLSFVITHLIHHSSWGGDALVCG